jgi:hypothetical protein
MSESSFPYISIIDSIIKTNEFPNDLKSKDVIKQLQSFLNINFTSTERHNIKKLINKRISKYQIQIKQDEINKKIAIESHLNTLNLMISKKIETKAWRELLYIQNVDTCSELTINSSTKSKKKIDISSNNELISKINRENITLCYQLNHSLNPFLFIPLKEEFIERRRINVKKNKKTIPKSFTFEDSLVVNQSKSLDNLFSWSEEVQNLLNIIYPLTPQEVLYLVSRYIKEHNLYKDSKFISDSKTTFLQTSGNKITNILEKLNSHRKLQVGFIEDDGSRILNESPNSPIPLEAYNINKELLTSTIEIVSNNTNTLKSFPKLYKSGIRKRKNTKIL